MPPKDPNPGCISVFRPMGALVIPVGNGVVIPRLVEAGRF